MKRIWIVPIVCLVQIGSVSAGELSATDAAASTPPVSYQSAFDGYRSYREEPIADWRALNDEVGRVGGHIGIFRAAGGHADHGGAKPVTGKPGIPASQKGAPAAEGQAPVRGAPQAPAGAGHQQH